MIRVLVLYPKTDDTKFDIDYWLTTHMPLVAESWPALVRWEADRGAPDSPYYAVAHLLFESMDDVGASMGSEGGGKVMADMANYTDVRPVVAMSEVAATS